MEQKYDELLAVHRLRPSTRGSRGIVDESESDKARVIYSAAFRRLQRKTQVFPLEENAAIRSRMTHSLEVAHVGRYIATTFLGKIKNIGGGLRDKYGLSEECSLAIPNIVETACLLHDIGNPPFGHFGEAAISNWFDGVWPKYKAQFFKYNKAVEKLTKDISVFDGNPQGFRFITRLGGVDDFGMNLTVAQIAATVKYPIFPDGIDKDHAIKKKAGIYFSESTVWKDVCRRLGMAQDKRFPLAYLMEAADDISYCLSDIEDGIEKGYLGHDELVALLLDGLDGRGSAKTVIEKAAKSAEQYSNEVEETVSFRARIVTFLVDKVAQCYIDNHQKIFDGDLPELIIKDSPESDILSAYKNVVSKKLYGKRASSELELTGLAAITGILSKYERLLELSREDFAGLSGGGKVESRLVEHQKLFSMMAPKHTGCYDRKMSRKCSDAEEWAARLHLIIDFVAGMTDVFALQMYQMLSGIRSR
jgi:dGTPase